MNLSQSQACLYCDRNWLRLRIGVVVMLISSAVAEYLRYCAIERQLSPHSLQACAVDLNDFHRFLGVDRSVESIIGADLGAYLRSVGAEEAFDLNCAWTLRLPTHILSSNGRLGTCCGSLPWVATRASATKAVAALTKAF
ncbi:site-specific integrase [Bradyrhizobium sp. 521_C7_N1_3]|uniref:site-specific integrase n=1 Tax=Bradyrhizobium sp. 521_C7_N1_3 TaxID=3240368 RepID=UPI003F8C812C